MGKGLQMFDVAPPPLPQISFLQPQQVKKKRGGRTAAAVAIGTVIILQDGSKCTVAGQDRNGQILCYPLQN
jgi:hypothetical protein